MLETKQEWDILVCTSVQPGGFPRLCSILRPTQQTRGVDPNLDERLQCWPILNQHWDNDPCCLGSNIKTKPQRNGAHLAITVDKSYSPDIGLMVGHRLRRWPTINPISVDPLTFSGGRCVWLYSPRHDWGAGFGGRGSTRHGWGTRGRQTESACHQPASPAHTATVWWPHPSKPHTTLRALGWQQALHTSWWFEFLMARITAKFSFLLCLTRGNSMAQR